MFTAKARGWKVISRFPSTDRQLRREKYPSTNKRITKICFKDLLLFPYILLSVFVSYLCYRHLQKQRLKAVVISTSPFVAMSLRDFYVPKSRRANTLCLWETLFCFERHIFCQSRKKELRVFFLSTKTPEKWGLGVGTAVWEK